MKHANGKRYYLRIRSLTNDPSIDPYHYELTFDFYNGDVIVWRPHARNMTPELMNAILRNDDEAVDRYRREAMQETDSVKELPPSGGLSLGTIKAQP